MSELSSHTTAHMHSSCQLSVHKTLPIREGCAELRGTLKALSIKAKLLDDNTGLIDN